MFAHMYVFGQIFVSLEQRFTAVFCLLLANNIFLKISNHQRYSLNPLVFTIGKCASHREWHFELDPRYSQFDTLHGHSVDFLFQPAPIQKRLQILVELQVFLLLFLTGETLLTLRLKLTSDFIP